MSSAPNYNQRCKICNAFIVFDLSKRERNGKCIPLDLNGKRHFCSSVDKIIHEGKIVQQFEQECDEINSVELSSFRLDVQLVEGIQDAS